MVLHVSCKCLQKTTNVGFLSNYRLLARNQE